MRFIVDLDFVHPCRPLGLHALKLRLALLAAYYGCRDSLPPGSARPAGACVPTVDLRRSLGLGAARDARALRRAVAELDGDPAFPSLSIGADGRTVAFTLEPSLRLVTYLLKYVLLDRDDFEKPRAIADFHLSMRYAQARRMAAPAVAVAPAEAAVMAGPGRRADLAWARRTLLPAAQRLAARIGGPVFLGGVWRDDPEQPLELRFRFGGPKTVWREQAMRKVHAHEHAWLATAGRAERLNRPRVTPLYEG